MALVSSPWVEIPDGSGFGLGHLPLGVGCVDDRTRLVTRIGDHVLALGDVVADPVLDEATANAFLARGRRAWADVRDQVRAHVTDARFARPLPPVDAVELRLPIAVGDYVDFYSSLDHATRVGRLFRPDADPLLANWHHLPVGYHGRAGTVMVSGSEVRRPNGLRVAPPDDASDDAGGSDGSGGHAVRRGPSRQLDLELEVGFVVGPASAGDPVAPVDADDHVVGVVLVNDWSARDIQAFEYQPLGPFLGKSFATSMSAWIPSLDVAAPAPVPTQHPTPDGALVDPVGTGLVIEVVAVIDGTEFCRTSTRHLYWTHRQQLAHLTSNGAGVRTGDLFATGTVSGPTDAERACLLEATDRGATPIRLADGRERTWLADGDTVTLTGRTRGADGAVIELGPVVGTVIPTRQPGGER